MCLYSPVSPTYYRKDLLRSHFLDFYGKVFKNIYVNLLNLKHKTLINLNFWQYFT